MPVSPSPVATSAVIIAGGQARRFDGRCKCLLPLGTRSVLHYLRQRLEHQQLPVWLNINQPPSSDLLLPPQIADTWPQARAPEIIGPLGGLISALEHPHLKGQCLLTVAGDTPFIPWDLYPRLHIAMSKDTDVVFARSGGREHFINALWHPRIKAPLHTFLRSGQRSVRTFIARLNARRVDFAIGDIDPFFNINTAEDWQRAEGYVQGRGG